MIGWRPRRRVLLLGQGVVADACERSLRAGPERVLRLDPKEVDAQRLRQADILILADAADPRSLLAAVSPRLERIDRRRPLRVLMLDDEARLDAETLAEATARQPSWARFEPVSLPRHAARRLLARWPLHWGADPRFGQRAHLLILGEQRFVDALLVHALRVSGYGEPRTRLTLLSDNPTAWETRFERAYPQARQIAELSFQSLAAPDLAQAPPVTMAVVCSTPAPQAVRQAQTLIKHLAEVQQCSPPVLVEVGDLRADGTLEDWDGQLIPIERRQLALERAVLLEGRGDELARVIHEHYRDTTEAQGRDPANEPAGQPWPLLAASYRDANRHQADHLWAKLAVTDCRAVPEEQVESFAFAPIEVERLAIIEHARWAADRWLDGWSYAPTRDNARKHHPQLIPYQQLSGPMKDLDRFAVRLLPTLLARSGLGVLRMLVLGLVSPPLSPKVPSAAPEWPPGLSEIPPGSSEARRSTRPPNPDRLFRQALRRLVARYPDRALVVAAALDDPNARRFTELATAEFGASLFVLLRQPLPVLLDGLEAPARRQMLALLTQAERRIALPEPNAFERWLEARAEILVDFGAGADAGTDASVDASAKAKARPIEAAPAERKWLRIDPVHGLRWTFEY
ncbi:MAG: RyR domain-containing protein [Halochromatium sp.]|uniref:RyR domain-containing protein n=1 Tax=Halochromatium sp. TaxID=2049430 RepID=UPI00397C6BD0